MSAKIKVEELRNKINDIDAQMAKLFEKRLETLKELLGYKLVNNLPIEETILLNTTLTYIHDELCKKFFVNFYTNLLALSKTYQLELLKDER